ncbi:carbohydrate kinase, FGGY family [Mycobacterium xenopi 3993]|nr:carbohydrate kinase, FGGY family [Mycobacterium xenopi 3993]
MLNTGEKIVRSQHGLLTTVCYQFGNAKPVYALEGSIAVTGSAVQWLRDQLGIISGAAQSETLAGRSTTTVASTSCRRFPVCSLPTGGRMHAG